MITIKDKSTNWLMKHIAPTMCSTIWNPFTNNFTIWIPSIAWIKVHNEVLYHEILHTTQMNLWWYLTYILSPWARGKWEAYGYLAALYYLKRNQPNINIDTIAVDYVNSTSATPLICGWFCRSNYGRQALAILRLALLHLWQIGTTLTNYSQVCSLDEKQSLPKISS